VTETTGIFASRWLRTCLALAVCLVLAPSGLHAQFQMPDPKQMSGIPRPVNDLPDQSISVRVIRGSLANNIPNQTVELHVGSKVLRAKTDDAGRAQFDKVTPGASVKAVADVDGEHLESQEFPAPAQGGIRLLLVATAKSGEGGTTQGAGATPGTPAVAGEVVIGGNSRVVIEPGDEALEIYYLLDIVNNASAPVTLPSLFMFDMPTGSVGCGLLEGSSGLAALNGTRVRVQGPFAPGSTRVQVFCELPVFSSSLDVMQKFPAASERVAVIVKRVGDTKISSPQLDGQQELTAQGVSYIAASGPGVAAGQPITLSLSDLPHHSSTPRIVALSLAGGIALIGVWAAARVPKESGDRVAERKRLTTRRNKLFDELIRLEQDHRAGRLDGQRYAMRREDLLASLEQVYGALDSDDAGTGRLDRASLAVPMDALRAP
jgi:hypothetical protein